MPCAGGHIHIWEQTPPEIHAVPVEPFGGIESVWQAPQPQGTRVSCGRGAPKAGFLGAATGETTMQTQHGAKHGVDQGKAKQGEVRRVGVGFGVSKEGDTDRGQWAMRKRRQWTIDEDTRHRTSGQDGGMFCQ